MAIDGGEGHAVQASNPNVLFEPKPLPKSQAAESLPLNAGVAHNGEEFIDIYDFIGQKMTQRHAPPAQTNSAATLELDSILDQGHLDVLIIGAGLSGISSLHRVRKLGLRVKIFESGLDFGGVWYWNRYPGARVDSEYPFYQLNIPEVYKTWNFSQRFPDHRELRRYMAHVQETLQLRNDVVFDAEVISAQYDSQRGLWDVKTAKGHRATAKYLILATGLLHKRYCPDFPGLSRYKGVVAHSSFWPEDMTFKGKNVGVIGAGATAVQIVQELAKETADSGSLTMFMRRPSTCVPMIQRNLGTDEQDMLRAYLPSLFEAGRGSHSGFPIKSAGCNVFDDTAEVREARFEELWRRGAFNFLLGQYHDMASDPKANREIYNFWARKVRARITDPVKRRLMAPEEPPYPIGTKRPPLENGFYEALDMKHVDIVDLNSRPFQTFTETGVILKDGTEKQLDAVALATGFDSFTGSITNLGLKGKDGVDIKEVWKDRIRTFLGVCMHGFPNCFIVYSPQAPTAFSNGPTIIETQSDFIVDMIAGLEKEGVKSIEPTTAAENGWMELITNMIQGNLMGQTDSWWNGANIPGKKRQVMTYAAGICEYERVCREALNGWMGFEIAKN